MINPRFLLIPVVLFFSCQTHRAKATWYSENIQSGADIIMMDLRWPWWPSGTYYANWNSSFNPQPNNITFYAGVTSFLADGPNATPNPDHALQSSFRPGNVWTFWGSDQSGTPVRFTDVAPNLYIKNEYGGEGGSATVGSHVWPFVKSKQWYTMVARVWRPFGKTDDAYVGRWIKDVEHGMWHLIGVARLPIPATSFKGNSGFIEPLTGETVVRPLHRRFGYFRKDGEWKKSDTISINKTQYVVVNTIAEGDHEYAAIEYAQRPDLLPQRLSGRSLSGDKLHHFTVKQPSLPTLDQPAVTNVRAIAFNGQIAVSWDVPKTASPAFSYKIEVFDNPDCKGKAIATKAERIPTARHTLIAAEVHSPTVRLTVTDIFDQDTPAVSVKATGITPPKRPAVDKKTIPGLAFELYHQDTKRRVNYFDPPLQTPNEEHHWLTLDELKQGTLVRRGLARGFDIGVREDRTQGYALRFNGLLRVPESGIYILRAEIDGAYRIQINGDDALVWDGQHGTTEKAAVLTLEKGEQPFHVTYLYDKLPTTNFSIQWEGPGLSCQPIPLEALRVIDDGAFPLLSLDAVAHGNGNGRIVAKVDARGHAVNTTALFLGNLQLAEGKGSMVTYDGPLAGGPNRLWSRTVFDDNHSVDSKHITLDVVGKQASSPWTVRNVGDAKATAGLWQRGTGAFEFFGEGMHTASQRIAGDFTATCRVDAYAGSQGEPVNHRAWVGLTAMEHGEKLNWHWGRYFHLVQTARDGLRASPDFTDLGGGRISSYQFPKDHPWLRIVRKGSIWTAWSSSDGKHWKLGGYQFKKTQPDMDVGLFFSALPQQARAHFSASVSNFQIQLGAVEGAVPPLPTPADDTDGDRLTGVVMAPSNSQVVVVRTTSVGLIRTADGGKTWTPANGKLEGANLSVRSVAIHPTNPLVMLRACGQGANGKLWKTVDGGKTWVKLDLDVDFDGVGPSTLCGEVVAFDLKSPQTMYVGSESKGFFKSTDSGTTWTNLGLAGERITAVTVWPWEKHYPGPAKGKTHLCVITCPDRWMTYLGRGKPGVSTSASTARSYVSKDSVKTLSLADERNDTGFFNVVFDKATQSVNEMRYATAHGYQTQVWSGTHMALYPEQTRLEWMRPFTALGATAMGKQKFGRVITQALNPIVPGRLSRSERWAIEWSWLPTQGAVPKGGLIAVSGDVLMGDKWWFVFTDGLYYSSNGGEHLNKIMNESGKY